MTTSRFPTEHVAETYLGWLINQVGAEHNHRLYGNLLKALHEKEFISLVDFDQNRIQDCFDLRPQCFRELHQMPFSDLERAIGPASFLELIVVMGRKLAFTTEEDDPQMWSWYLLQTLGLNKFWGHLGHTKLRRIDTIVDDVIWRQYEPDGRGGLFPLSNPMSDQRDVELWYQMAAYVNEMLDG